MRPRVVRLASDERRALHAGSSWEAIKKIRRTDAKTITLNSEVLITGCGTGDHTTFFFGMSIEPRDGEMWKRIDAIRDTFRCSR